jgi:predicted nucleic acid-binding protein
VAKEGHIIDCCSLLNLHAGWSHGEWGGLEQLGRLPWKWHVCERVLGESEYTRERNNSGEIIEVPLNLQPFKDSGLLSEVKPENGAELADYVSFAGEVDDGEAQALAIAKHRKLILLTDDRKAARIAARGDVGVEVVTTVGVLKEWIGQVKVTDAAVCKVIERMESLARFAPPRRSADSEWWLAHRK